jgi:adenine-specific DNA-methyltransferase
MHRIEDFENRIIAGDCVRVMLEMPAESVDLVVTDPPYLARYQSRDGRRVANDDPSTGSEWLSASFEQIYRVLKPDRFCVSFYGWHQADRFLRAWRRAGFRPVGHLVWVKDYHSNERFLRYSHEAAYLLAKGDPPKPAIALRDVLEWQYTGDELHPTQKPLMAMLPLIMAYSALGDIVLDPFVGSGTTAVAAQALGRRFIGIELEPVYAQVATERVMREALRERAGGEESSNSPDIQVSSS